LPLCNKLVGANNNNNSKITGARLEKAKEPRAWREAALMMNIKSDHLPPRSSHHTKIIETIQKIDFIASPFFWSSP
jgi:hypothetical protein